MQHVEILWDDLSEKGQKKMSEAIKIPVEEVIPETNWDIYPLATYDYDDDPNSL